MVKNFLIISKLEKDVTPDLKIFASTSSPEAYRYFIDGDNAFWERDYSEAVKLYSKAAAIDSNFTVATIMLSVAYGDQGLYDQARKWCLRAYSKRDQLPIQQKIFTNWIYAQYFETPFERIKYINQLLELDDQLPILYYQLCLIYNELLQYDKAIPEGEKALEIYNKWDSKPKVVNIFTVLGKAYHETNQYKKEKKLYKDAEQYFPDNPEIIRREVILSLTEGDTLSANQYLDKYRYILKENSESEANIITSLASVYYETGILDKAEELYRQSLSLQPQNSERMNNLAWVLIDNDLNINEGLELIDKALELDSDNYKFVDTKGWGLYKQGKNKEALKLLERSWDLKPIYNHVIYLHIKEVKKAIGTQ
jgi:tetratricopeptide (TPR) repeat protein